MKKGEFFDWLVQKEKFLSKYPTPWELIEKTYNPIALIFAWLALLNELGISSMLYAARYGTEAAIENMLEPMGIVPLFFIIQIDPIAMGFAMLAVVFALLARKYLRKGKKALIMAGVVVVLELSNIGTAIQIVMISLGEVIRMTIACF